MIQQRSSRKLFLGKLAVGGGSPVSVQSMCNTATSDADATLNQIKKLTSLGCQLIRVSVDEARDAFALGKITAESPIPVIADIQFDPRMALAAIEGGVAGIRLNPGLIADRNDLAKVAKSALSHGVPIRVGANAGSIKRHEFTRRIEAGMNGDEAVAEALVDAALRQCAALEQFGMRDIKVALKSSSVPITIAACEKFAARTDYPLHLGLTEAGTPGRGIVKSAVAIGSLLLRGIGDTIRVSLTAPPEEEVIAGCRILEACGLRDAMPEIVSCPTCGRTEIDLVDLATRVDSLVSEIKNSGGTINLKKIAVMGCPVNGPGEARDADLGMAGCRNGQLIIFRFGEVVGAFDAEHGFEYFKMEILKNTTPAVH